MLTFIDLFCGIGGFHQGMTQAGFKSVFACDINPFCREVYEANFGQKPFGDIQEIDNFPDHDVLCAGFPCQPFSGIGRRLGFQDTRGTLFFEILRVIQKKHPPVVFLENVEGLKKHDGGRTLEIMIQLLEQEGYHVSYSILNASDFGIPQNRPRTIIIASKTPFSFSNISKQPKGTVRPLLEDVDTWISPDKYTLIPNPKQQKSGLIFAGFLNSKPRKGVDPNKLHLSRTHKQQYRIYSASGVFPTINSQELSGRLWIELDGRVRKLTLKECYRLMGFPDDFINNSPPIEQRRQIGNSVPVPMIKEVARQIYELLY